MTFKIEIICAGKRKNKVMIYPKCFIARMKYNKLFTNKTKTVLRKYVPINPEVPESFYATVLTFVEITFR